MVNKFSSQWRCIGESVRGASHKRKSLPNQDAIKISFDHQLPIILAISDGHGSAKSFRSQTGSEIAVNKAIEAIQELFPTISEQIEQQSFRPFSETVNLLENILPRKIVHKWKECIDNQSAITEEEWENLEQQEGKKAKQLVVENPTIAYGATLLCVFVTDFFILYLQLGDGDILCVNEEGQVTRPLPPDERLLANETTSLCLKNAWKDFRIHIEPYPPATTKKKPVLILVSTDGYGNSYASEEDLCEVAREHLDHIRQYGVEKIEKELSQLLEEVSTKGSGDDITLGMIRQIELSDSDAQNSRISQTEEAIETVKEVQETQRQQIEEISKIQTQNSSKTADDVENIKNSTEQTCEQFNEIHKSLRNSDEDLKKKITKLQKRTNIALTIAIASLFSIPAGIWLFSWLNQTKKIDSSLTNNKSTIQSCLSLDTQRKLPKLEKIEIAKIVRDVKDSNQVFQVSKVFKEPIKINWEKKNYDYPQSSSCYGEVFSPHS